MKRGSVHIGLRGEYTQTSNETERRTRKYWDWFPHIDGNFYFDEIHKWMLIGQRRRIEEAVFMTCPADLHTHTTASDGQYTPSQLAAKALAAGIQILAVTDHDTMDGAEEAVRAGQACGLTVLRGVELGAREDRHMHILGLNLGPECPALAELCRRLRASREERKYRIAAFLRGKGLDVPLEEVEALAGAEWSPAPTSPG